MNTDGQEHGVANYCGSCGGALDTGGVCPTCAYAITGIDTAAPSCPRCAELEAENARLARNLRRLNSEIVAMGAKVEALKATWGELKAMLKARK